MGKTRSPGNNRNGNRSTTTFEGELTTNPFKGALKDFKIAGPECLHCRKELDTREGRSLPNPRGSRNSIRHGYMHAACELEASEKFYKVEWKQQAGRYLQYVLVSEGLLVPVHTDTELLAMIKAGETS